MESALTIPVHNEQGQQVDQLQVDSALLGGEVRPGLLKQAYVRYHANLRQGSAATKSRGQVEGSTRKLYKQKGTGNARRGSIRSNILKGGGHAKAKRPRSWRQDMPEKMRRLANRNAVLAKVVDGQLKLVDRLVFEKPSTKRFSGMLTALKVDRSCLVALGSTQGHEARSAGNLDQVKISRIDQLNVFDLLNHRYVVADKATFSAWLDRVSKQALGKRGAMAKEAV
jgi:large subunit ribosomal protein L4